MTKETLIYHTLKQLYENLQTSPQNFKYEDPTLGSSRDLYSDPTIIWQFKVELKEGVMMVDPLNASRTIIATYNDFTKQLSCYIYFREVSHLSPYSIPENTAIFQCYEYQYFNRSYRLFMKIKKQLINARKEKEFLSYMKRLSDIFPSIHEDELFK